MSTRGTTYWDWTLAPVMEKAGRVQGFVLSRLDVTARNRAEMEIRRLTSDLERNIEGQAAANEELEVANFSTLLFVSRAPLFLLTLSSASAKFMTALSDSAVNLAG